MDVKLTQSQFNEFCLKESCIKELTSLLNNVTTKNIFRKTIDIALENHKQFMDPESEQYKKDAEVLKKYFNFDDEDINKIMKIKMVYDDNGNWVPINKLNTNYTDLSVLITDILVDEGECICKVVESLKQDDNSVLIKLSDKMMKDPESYYEKYLHGNFDKYVQNNRRNTILGDESELFAISEMEKLGYKLVYLTSEGSPIDTKLGVDAILEKDGEIFKIQIKSVGSLTNTKETPCDVSNPGIKEKGGVKVFKRNRITVNEKYVDYLIFIGPSKKMMTLKKYQPISIDSIRPLRCVAKPINEFPKNNTFIDHESIVYKNF